MLLGRKRRLDDGVALHRPPQSFLRDVLVNGFADRVGDHIQTIGTPRAGGKAALATFPCLPTAPATTAPARHPDARSGAETAFRPADRFATRPAPARPPNAPRARPA